MQLGDTAQEVGRTTGDSIRNLARYTRAAKRSASPATESAVAGLTGGALQNLLLLEGSRAPLLNDFFTVHTHRQRPAHDGGIALEWALVAVLREMVV